MGIVVNVHRAKTHFSKYLEQVIAGDEIILGKYGKPVAKIVPIPPVPAGPRKPGALKGKIWIANDFDEPMTEWMEAIEKKKL